MPPIESPTLKEIAVRAFVIFEGLLRHEGLDEETIVRTVMYLAAESMAAATDASAVNALVSAVEFDLRERLAEYGCDDRDDELPRC